MIMARKDERRKAAWEFAAECTKGAFYPNDYDGYESSCAQSEIAGNFIAGTNWADRTMIEKVCDLLGEFNRKQIDKFFGQVPIADVTIDIEQFKQALKGD